MATYAPKSSAYVTIKGERDGTKNQMKISWSAKSEYTNTSSGRQFEWYEAWMEMVLPTKYQNNGKYVDVYRVPPSGKHSWNFTAADRFLIHGMDSNSVTKTFDRTRYHPCKEGRYCTKIKCGAAGLNDKGSGPWNYDTYSFAKPDKPTIKFTYDKDTAKLKITVKTAASKGNVDRYDTKIKITIVDANNKTHYVLGKKTKKDNTTTTKDTEWNKNVDLSKYLGALFQLKHSIRVKVVATARGMAGDTTAKSTYYVAYPRPATIDAIERASVKNGSDLIRVTATAGKFTKKVQLERSHAGSGDWTAVSGAFDDSVKEGSKVYLYDNYGDAEPVPGEYIYYRIKSSNENHDMYTDAKRADVLYTEKTELKSNASQEIISAMPGSDCTSVKVLFAFNDNVPKKWKWVTKAQYNKKYSGQPIYDAKTENSVVKYKLSDEDHISANVGTEITYSTNLMDWKAINIKPTEIDVVLIDDPTAREALAKYYQKSQTFTIGNLTPDTHYYIKARRYRYSADNDKIFAPYVSSEFTTPATPKEKNRVLFGDEVYEGQGANVVYGVKLVVGIDEPAGSDYTGTEITYSTSKAAWDSSNVGYTAVEFPLAQPIVNPYDEFKAQWPKVVEVFVTGMDQGVEYYFKSRRFKTSGGSSKVFTEFSDEPYARQMNSAADDQCAINAFTFTGGTIAQLDITITEDNPNTGTEIQWTDYENGWRSNVQPDSTKLEGSEWTPVQGKQTVYLRNLKPKTQYWVRARRYLVVGQSTTYSPWSSTQTFITYNDPVKIEDNDCRIIDKVVDESGTGVKFVIGYRETSPGAFTELSWSTDPSAWVSNSAPNTMNVDWKDVESADSEYPTTQTVYVRGLELNRHYTFKVRRCIEDARGTVWTEYSEPCTVDTPSKATRVDVRCGLLEVNDPGVDGTSLEVVVGWDGDHSGVEVTWSDDQRAWKSSSAPQTFTFDWEDETDDQKKKSRYYELTEDVAIDDSKTYYQQVIDQDGNISYEEVQSPSASSLSEYYEEKYTWNHTGTCYLNGLTEGTQYYVRARSYYEGDDGTYYSDYTEDLVAIPYSTPDSVVLSTYESIMTGESIECWWSIGSTDVQNNSSSTTTKEQTAWEIFECDLDRETAVYYMTRALAKGEGSLCRTTLPPDIYGNADKLSFLVRVSCGGGYTESEPVTVGIVHLPMCEIAADNVLTAQPAQFEAYTDDPGTLLLASCYANGINVALPDGSRPQFEGDTVWTEVIDPAWEATTWAYTKKRAQLVSELAALATEKSEALSAFEVLPEYSDMVDAQEILDGLDPSDPGYEEALEDYEEARETAYATDEGSAFETVQTAYADKEIELAEHPANETIYQATVEILPSDLWDDASYRFSVRGSEPTYGHATEAAEASFVVNYLHQAPEPSPNVSIIPDVPSRTVRINLPATQAFAGTDVYDVYRMTPSGYELALADIAPGEVVLDRYVPYGGKDLSYRIVTRTVDGDIDWVDYTYSMPIHVLRFDWDNNHVELPWNVGLTKSYKKSFEGRSKLNGDVHGRWDKAVSSEGGYTTDLIRIADSDLLRLVYQLAEYSGAVWVRDGYGQAMACNVDLSNVQIENKSVVVALSFNITQVKMPPEFLAVKDTEV